MGQVQVFGEQIFLEFLWGWSITWKLGDKWTLGWPWGLCVCLLYTKSRFYFHFESCMIQDVVYRFRNQLCLFLAEDGQTNMKEIFHVLMLWCQNSWIIMQKSREFLRQSEVNKVYFYAVCTNIFYICVYNFWSCMDRCMCLFTAWSVVVIIYI